MKWIFILSIGSLLAETTFSWTYHYSNDTMDWHKARQWCKSNFTDMVVIQNQAENDHLVSILPNRSQSPYYWIGITRNHENETWTWIGNNSTWIGNNSWAPNEPNNHNAKQFCVEIYMNTGPSRGKWNDESCGNPKYPVCYRAQCNATICGNGTCQETIENITCLCEPGYEGDRCQTAVECPPLSQPGNGSHSCSGGNQTFNSTCQFECQPGFRMTGLPNVTCMVTGSWSGQEPTCKAVECDSPPQPDNGLHSCSGGKQTWNSTCQFYCHPGFMRIGSPTITCRDTGEWSGPRPICTSYKQALLALTGCGAVSAFCCICFCWMKRRKRKKLAQARPPEEVTCPPSEAQQSRTTGTSFMS